MFLAAPVTLLVACAAHGRPPAPEASPMTGSSRLGVLEAELVARWGEAQRARIHRGLVQAAAFWRSADGSEDAFADMARDNFSGDPAQLDELFARMESTLESIDGHMLEISRDMKRQTDLDLGPVQPFDDVLAAWDPSAHVVDDFFANRLAFAVLLNFPITNLAGRLAEGPQWSRRQWAEARLVDRFSRRVPASVVLANSKAQSDAAAYIASYNIWMHHVLTEDGQRLFPPKLRLLSHWNLRDEIRAEYAEGSAALPKQRLIQKVMESIVAQTIPDRVVDNPQLDWNPWTSETRPTTDADSDAQPPKSRVEGREPDRRYERLLEVFRAQRQIDSYSPTAPTLIARRFEEERQLPEARVRGMLEAVLGSPLVPRVAALIQKRLGRPLEPFDLWYDGFNPRTQYTEAQLDEIVRKKYPTAEAYQQDIPNLLMKLGFAEPVARRVAANIVVDPARGSGHAMGAAWRGDKAHLRTRVEKNGMNYKGFNIAVHEMGHNVEQTFSLNDIDHTLLMGIPNTAFTEALAFVFQEHDTELLGLGKPDPAAQAMKALRDFWATYEIAGVALVDMGVWHWMYDHPDANAAQLREATLAIARNLWNQWYAPVFGRRDVVLLAVYSHMIDSVLYLPDYPIGHMIAFQVEEQMQKAGAIGPEFERIAKEGNVLPDMWMIHATGAPVGPESLLNATKRALDETGLNGTR
jgi:hypothetical protein